MTVVERGSTHIAYQDALLREEHEKWGVPYRGTHSRLIAKEVGEYHECDYITVQSTFAWRSFVEKGIPDTKLIKLPLAVDLHMFRPAPKQDRVFRVLYAGTLSLRKGTPYLLEAVSRLRLPNFEFVVNGTIAPEVEPIVRRYADRIRFLGTRPFNQLYQVYSQASVLVLPTIEDGFAKVITEAMACGVPVIATTHCSAEDVFTDGVEGYIVPIRDADAIRERILFLYENPDVRDEMAQAAQRRIQSGADGRDTARPRSKRTGRDGWHTSDAYRTSTLHSVNLLCITLLPAVPALSGVTSLTVCSRGDWAELYRYYSQGSIFVIASIEEGLALGTGTGHGLRPSGHCHDEHGGGGSVFRRR